MRQASRLDRYYMYFKCIFNVSLKMLVDDVLVKIAS